MTAVKLNPQPGEMWSTSKGRCVEILARDLIEGTGEWDDAMVDVIAYRFLGGTTSIHLRAVGSLVGWHKIQFE